MSTIQVIPITDTDIPQATPTDSDLQLTHSPQPQHATGNLLLSSIALPHYELLRDYWNLTDSSLRKRLETPRGLYIAESEKVISRALRAGHIPRSFIMEDKYEDTLVPFLKKATASYEITIPCFIGSRQILETLTGYTVHRGTLGSFHRPVLPAIDELLANAYRVAVLEDIVDHTNMGAIFRSAAALGIDAILISPRCADPLYRRSIRVSMGTVFQVPWTRIPTWPIVPLLREEGFYTVGLALDKDAIDLHSFALQARTIDKIALCFGSEGPGLTPTTKHQCDQCVMIPMYNGVDSLNVAASSAVTFWALQHPRLDRPVTGIHNS